MAIKFNKIKPRKSPRTKVTSNIPTVKATLIARQSTCSSRVANDRYNAAWVARMAAILTLVSACPAHASAQNSLIPVGALGERTSVGDAHWSNALIARSLGRLNDTMTSAKSACEAGTAIACSLIGEFMAGGRLGTPYPVQAVAYFKRGCELGNANACHGRGLILVQGIGLPADIAKGRSSLQLSCSLGSSMGCTNFGIMILSGLYGPVEPEFARCLLTRAIELWPDNQTAKTTLSELPTATGSVLQCY
jgi:TPR repeat protein